MDARGAAPDLPVQPRRHPEQTMPAPRLAYPGRGAEPARDDGATVLAIQRGAALAADMAAGLRAGQAFAAAYARAKRSAGVADFNDHRATTDALAVQRLKQAGAGSTMTLIWPLACAVQAKL